MNLFRMTILSILFHGTIGAMNLPKDSDVVSVLEKTKTKTFVLKKEGEVLDSVVIRF